MDRKKIVTNSIIVVLLIAVIVEGVMLTAGRKTEERGENVGFVLNTTVSDNGTLTDEENIKRINNNVSYMQKLIDQYYLYDVEESEQETQIYKGVVNGLNDPYSEYYTPEEYDSMMVKSKGEYSGIGAVLSQDKESMLISVARIYEGSPAEEAGLLPDDIIMKVDGTDISQMELSDAVILIKGEEDTTVTLEIYRKSEYDYKTVELTRKSIELTTLTYEMLEDKIGYIYIATWDEVTASQYFDAIQDLEKAGMERLIIDLRDNGGGVFSAACQVLDYMVKDGKTLVYTLTKEGEKTEITGTDGHSFTKPFVVLVNGNSASASEIFAGGIQDYQAGKIVGTTTYGKGIVQRYITLGSGAAMKVTISEYYLPSGVCIHKKGITPDVEVELNEELKTKVTVTQEDDNQLQKAIEVIKSE